MYSGSVAVSIRYKVFDVRILWLIEPFIVYCEWSNIIFNNAAMNNFIFYVCIKYIL